MSFSKKLVAVLMVAASLLSVVSVGCAPREVTAAEIKDKVLLAAPKMTVVSMDMTMDMNLNVSGGKTPGNMVMAATGTAYLNSTAKEMKFDLNADIDIPGLGKQQMPMEMYMQNGWTYVGVSVPMLGRQWMKMKLDDETWAQQDQLAQQLDLLKSAVQVTRLADETVDGVDSYVLKIEPDAAAISKWAMSQQSQQTGVDLSEVDLSKLFKNMSVTEWISKSNYQPTKAVVSVSLEMTPDALGQTDSGGKMTMEMSATVKYYDWGKTQTIELPKEAQNAIEAPAR